MIIDILIWVAFLYFACGLLTGRFPHEILPPVKRRRIAAARRREEERMLDRIEREEEQARRDALRALRVDDVAFLSAGGHWQPPSEVTDRLRNEAFLREEEAREMQRIEYRRKAIEAREKERDARQQRLALPAAERVKANAEHSKQKGHLTAAEVAQRHAKRAKQAKAKQLDAQIMTYQRLGIPFEELHTVAVIATGPAERRSVRQEITSDGIVTYYGSDEVYRITR